MRTALNLFLVFLLSPLSLAIGDEALKADAPGWEDLRGVVKHNQSTRVTPAESSSPQFKSSIIVVASNELPAAPSVIFGIEARNIFELRAPAAMLAGSDIPVLEYALEQSSPRLLIFLGHDYSREIAAYAQMVKSKGAPTDPAGVFARFAGAIEGFDVGAQDPSMRMAAKVIVSSSLQFALKNSAVLRSKIDSGLLVARAVYDPVTGELKVWTAGHPFMEGTLLKWKSEKRGDY